MSDTHLIVFTRPIGDPAAKSRLAAGIGAAAAGALHDALVRRAARIACQCGAEEVEICLSTDGPEAANIVARMRQRLPYPLAYGFQQGHDLGARMYCAAERALGLHGTVVIMGTDCAVIEADHILNAVAALSTGTPAAFIPVEDGGYVLVALNRCDARLFRNIAWGTATVMDETRAVLRSMGWGWAEMPALWDIDSLDDYERLVREGRLDALLAV